MKRVPLFSVLVLVLVSVACAGSAPEPTPTVTPEPPTATLLPTETATPKPTATSTPDRAATAAVEATQIAGDVQAELGELLGDSGIAYEEGKLAWQQSERMEVNLRGPDGRFLPFAEGVKGKKLYCQIRCYLECDGYSGMRGHLSFRAEFQRWRSV